MACADLAECDDLTVCVPPQLWSAMPSLEGEEVVECEEFWVCVAGIETTEENFGARTNPKASPNFQGHTSYSGFCFSEFTLGEAPGKKLANFYSANL